jgi:hypothetical protein
MVVSYRSPTRSRPFSTTPFLTHRSDLEYDFDFANPIHLCLRSESMVFHIPGWQSFSVREVAKLRISEEPITKETISGFEWGMAGTQYLEDMRNREAEMSGKKEVSEEVLKEWLKGDALDMTRFSEW